MAARNLFPFAEDREVIKAFLRGEVTFDCEGAELMVRSGNLSRTPSPTAETIPPAIAWHDTGGALTLSPFVGCDQWPAVRVANTMLEMIGDDRRIEPEKRDGKVEGVKFFFDGVEVTPGSPIVLAGPMSVRAYRASRTTVGKP